MIAMIGASGGIGREIVRCAAKDPRVSEITLIVRRTLEEWTQENFKPKLNIIQRENLENLHELKEQLMGFDIFISTMGALVKVGEE